MHVQNVLLVTTKIVSHDSRPLSARLGGFSPLIENAPKATKTEEAQVTKSIAQVFESAEETLQVPGLDDLSPH